MDTITPQFCYGASACRERGRYPHLEGCYSSRSLLLLHVRRKSMEPTTVHASSRASPSPADAVSATTPKKEGKRLSCESSLLTSKEYKGMRARQCSNVPQRGNGGDCIAAVYGVRSTKSDKMYSEAKISYVNSRHGSDSATASCAAADPTLNGGSKRPKSPSVLVAKHTESFSVPRRKGANPALSLLNGDFLKHLGACYRRTQSPLVALIDSFIVSLLLMAALLSLYVLVVGTNFPRNACVAALLSCGGTAVLTICLRIQVSERHLFDISEERALADYLLCNLVLHYAVFSYVG